MQTLCLLLLTAVAAGVALYWLRPVLIPLGLAVFLHLVLMPVVDYLVLRWRWPQPVAASVALLPALGALLLAGALIMTSLRRLAGKVDVYKANMWALLERVSDEVPLLDLALREQKISEHAIGLPVTDILLGTTNALFEVVSNLVLVLIFVLFLLLRHAPRPAAGGTLRTMIDTRVRRYLVVKFAVSSVTGLLVGTILGVLQVDLWLVFGLLAFGMNFIPSIGSIVATLLPLPMVLVSPDVTVTRVLLVLGIPGALQFTIGNLLEPKVLGDSLDLHPVTILAALIFWGSLWGIVGMLMAAPITAVVKITMEEFEITRPIARVIAGH